MPARIYQIPKNSLQSGKARTHTWLLEFEPSEARTPDPMTGWAGSGDTQQQVKLSFPSEDAARDYCDRCGLSYHVVRTPSKTLKIQAYADNFR